MSIREIHAALEALRIKWYAGDIDNEMFAYEVFDLNSKLAHFIGLDEN